MLRGTTTHGIAPLHALSCRRICTAITVLMLHGAFTGPAAGQGLCHWSPLSSGIDGGAQERVGRALAISNNSIYGSLVLGGRFTSVGGVSASNIAEWDGSVWRPLGAGVGGYFNDGIRSIAPYSGSGSERLIVAGSFTQAGGSTGCYMNIAAWNGTNWECMGSGLGQQFGSSPSTLAVYSESVFADCCPLSQWSYDTFAWTPMTQPGSDDEFVIESWTSYDSGNGPLLVVTGNGQTSKYELHAWDGSAWHTLPAPAGANGYNLGLVATLTLDSHQHLAFVSRQGYVGLWDGSSWTQIGDLRDGITYFTHMSSHDLGWGERLFVSGWRPFGSDGSPSYFVKQWDGVAWTDIAPGLNAPVEALMAFDDGTGIALYATGHFTEIDGVQANRVAKLTCLCDCDQNGVVDSEQIAAGGLADCNNNAIADICETETRYVSPRLVPFDSGNPASLVIELPPDPQGDVSIDITVRANLQGLARFVTVNINGATYATLFATDGELCPPGAQTRSVILTPGEFAAFGKTGTLEIALIPSGAVTGCDASFASIVVRYQAPTDCDGDGEWDQCQIAADPYLDCDQDGGLDSCQLPLIDCDGNGLPDDCEIRSNAGLDCDANGVLDLCELAGRPDLDCDGDGAIDACQIDSDPTLDCNSNLVLDSCELDGGLAADCDANGMIDMCEISAEPSRDCDDNQVLDVCEPRFMDCNANGVRDACEIAADPLADTNDDGVLDICNYARGDFTLDGQVDGADLSLLLLLWGEVDPEIGDLTGDGLVNGSDLGYLLLNWGPISF